jgi:vacuolar iron transporter family protein
LREHGLDPLLAETVAAAITSDRERWTNFMMRFELGLEEPEAGREFKSALTISGAYIAGGLLPLAPYFLLGEVSRALPTSVALTLAALLIFGAVKGHFTGVAPVRSALQTALVGTLAATAAFAIARLVSG